ncbi:MAG: Crp/Fnr family transcriptional regulator [Clostridia bacterium]|nr:Crp/Fnr family transcriptional regulator [Clostridia bacterium]
MKEYLEILAKCPLFANIEEQNLLRMLHCLGAKVEHFDKKYTIFHEGMPARQIGIVLSGAVQVVRVDYYGNRSILTELGAPHVFAEAFACAEAEALPVSVIASEPSDIMLIDCRHILHTCQNACGHHHSLIFNLMKDLAEKTLLFHKRIEITGKRTTREKLLAYLSAEAKAANSRILTVPFDRQELADYLEVDRSGLSAEISKLRREGVLRCEKNRFELL